MKNNSKCLEIECIKIKNSVVYDEKEVMKINIEYPKIANESLFAMKFNKFYKTMSEKFQKYYEGESKRLKIKEYRCAHGEVMRYYIPENDGKYLSVIIEFSHFDTFFIKKKRISHVWDTEHGRIIPLYIFLKESGLKRNDILKKLKIEIMESVEVGNNEMELTKRGLHSINRHFCYDNYFIANGKLAIYFQSETISQNPEVFPTYFIAEITR